MAATKRAGSTSFNNGGTLTQTVTKPAGTAEGDFLLIVAYMHDSGGTVIQWPPGFTEIDQVTNGSTTFTGGAAWKIAGGSEPADYTLTQGNGQSGTDQFVGMIAVQGADTSAPIADAIVQLYEESVGTASTNAPSVAGVDDGLLVCAWLQQRDAPQIVTLDPPGSMTVGGTGQTSVSAGGYSIGTWASEALTANGATGQRTAVLNPAVNDFVHVGISVVVAPASAAAPIANAGPDQLVAQGAQDVQMAGSASANGGAGAPYTWLWSIVSDTTGGAQLSSTTVQNPQVDLGPNAGTTVVGLVATDAADVSSAQDTMTITAVGAAGLAVPIADLTVAGWTSVPAGLPIYPKLADTSDATYALYVDPVGDVTGAWDMSNWTPTPGVGAVLNVRTSMIGASATIDIELREGASTVIASWLNQTWTAQNIVQGMPLAVTPAQVASIGDPNNLRVIITGGVTA